MASQSPHAHSSVRRLAWVVALPLAAAACTTAGADTDDPACQIQVDGEKSPGYPYDLEQFQSTVLPVLSASCATAGCHGPPTGTAGFTVWPAAAAGNCDYAKTFNTLTGFVDLANPANSAMLVAVNGALPSHPVQLTADDPKLAALTSFVQSASDRYKADGGGGTAPPGASPFDYAVYQSTIQPIFDTAEGRGCAAVGCHGAPSGAAGFSLVATPAADSADMQANFIAVTARANLPSPDSSLIYLKATTRHAGGSSTVASPEQAAALLAWIQAAADNNGGGPAPNCAPLDRFNSGVFRDEIMPILRGDVDLNRVGGGSGVGCMRGPCHGTDRGPGTLTLTDGPDVSASLQSFACFVDLVSPSASDVLRCPLDDPRCRHTPHPGQDVFSGGEDLNYQRVLAFLYGSNAQATPADFAFFVRKVNPIFNDLQAVENGAQNRTCADTVGCHGVSVVGQAPPNGSNFPIIPNAADRARLTFNFASASGFINFLSPQESSLFLYPTNEIADVANHPLATGLPHPGGTDFAVDSIQAVTILRWAHGLRPDDDGFLTDWLVAGDYPASRITDTTAIDELNSTPQIFDPDGAPQFNGGQWDGLFADVRDVDLNTAFPRDATTGRIAYAVAYLVNTTGVDLTAQLAIDSPNATRVYVGNTLVAQNDQGGPVTAIARVPAFATAGKPVRVMLKLFQRSTDRAFTFNAQVRDELGNLITADSGDLIVLLGPQGGI